MLTHKAACQRFLLVVVLLVVELIPAQLCGGIMMQPPRQAAALLAAGLCMTLALVLYTMTAAATGPSSVMAFWAGGQNHKGWKTISVFVGDSTYGSPTRWNSQVKQDETVAAIFNHKTNGYFVDLAANDAVNMSNTWSLERYYDWSGACIEANSEYM